jgi:uncharacterized membrane protein
MFRTKVVEKIKTHILCSVYSPSPRNRVVYEIMWKNVVEPNRSQMTIWRVRIACFSTATMVARTRLSVMLYVHCLSFCRFDTVTCCVSRKLTAHYYFANISSVPIMCRSICPLQGLPFPLVRFGPNLSPIPGCHWPTVSSLTGFTITST